MAHQCILGGVLSAARWQTCLCIASTPVAHHITHSGPVVMPCRLPDRQTASWSAYHTQTSSAGNFPCFVRRIRFDRKRTPVCKVHFKTSVLVSLCRSDGLAKGGERRTSRWRMCSSGAVLLRGAAVQPGRHAPPAFCSNPIPAGMGWRSQRRQVPSCIGERGRVAHRATLGAALPRRLEQVGIAVDA